MAAARLKQVLAADALTENVCTGEGQAEAGLVQLPHHPATLLEVLTVQGVLVSYGLSYMAGVLVARTIAAPSTQLSA